MDYALKLKKINRLRWACRAVVTGATLMSIWSNYLIASQDIRSQIISCTPPVIVLGGFELVSRIPLREGGWLIKSVRPIATAAITLGGAYLSYFHQKDAFMRYSADVRTALVLPGLIDGLMVVAAVSLGELNATFMDLENRQAGLNVTLAKPKREAVKATNVRVLSGKERIAQVLADAPDLAVKEIAARAQVSYNYAHSIVKELRRPAIEA